MAILKSLIVNGVTKHLQDTYLSTRKLISLFPDTIKLSQAGQRFQITIYATDDCGEIMIDDPFGLYDVEKMVLV